MRKSNMCFIIILMLILSSCSSGGYSYNASEEGVYEQAESEKMYDDTGEASDIVEKNETRKQKLQKEGRIENITKSYEEDKNKVDLLVDKYEGYYSSVTESSNAGDTNRKVYATIKVPVENFQSLYEELKQCGVNIYNENSTINQTSGYYSLKSQIEVKQEALKRVEATIEKAKKPEEIIELYKYYYELSSEIEIMEQQLTNIEYKTSYSTIMFTLEEVKDEDVQLYVENDFFSKIKKGFKDSWEFSVGLVEGVILGLARISVPAIVIILLALPFRKCIIKAYKKIRGLNKKSDDEIEK